MRNEGTETADTLVDRSDGAHEAEATSAGFQVEEPRGFAALLRHKAEDEAERARSASDPNDVSAQILRLQRLNEAGHLSDKDLAAARKKLLLG